MGRMHTPTAVLDARGAFLKHPERARPKEPQPTKKLGSPPGHLTDDQKKIWNEFKRKLPPGVAFDSDSWAVEMIVKLMDRQRKDAISEAGANRLMNLMARFGLTPADRAKVVAGGAEPQDELAKWLEKPKSPRPGPVQ